MGGKGSGWFASAGHVSHKPKYAIGKEAAKEALGETYLGQNIRKQPEKLPGAYKYKSPKSKPPKPKKQALKALYKDFQPVKDRNDAETRLRMYVSGDVNQDVLNLPPDQRDEVLKGLMVLHNTGVQVDGIYIEAPHDNPSAHGMYSGDTNEIWINPTAMITGPRPTGPEKLKTYQEMALGFAATQAQKDEINSIKRTNAGDDTHFLAAVTAHESHHAKQRAKIRDSSKRTTAWQRTMRKYGVTRKDVAQVSAYAYSCWHVSPREIYAEVGTALFLGETYVPQCLMDAYNDRRWMH